MKLRNFRAERYKSLREIELGIQDLLIVIGQNNGGKSNLFHALELFFTSSARGVSKDTFFNGITIEPIILTAQFDNLSTPEIEKLGPWTIDGTLTVSKEYTMNESGGISVDYFAIMKAPKEPWLNEGFGDYANREVVSHLPISEFLPSSGRITKEIFRETLERYRESHTVEYIEERRKNPGGFKGVLDGYMPEFHLVPAVREATEETKTASTALLGRLMAVVVRRISESN